MNHKVLLVGGGGYVGSVLAQELVERGYVTLSDVAEVQYKCTGFYTPSSEGTLAWNDPEVGIEWPIKDPILSKRDSDGMSLHKYLEKPAFYYTR